MTGDKKSSKKKSSSDSIKRRPNSLRITDRIDLDVTRYRGKTWLHFKDRRQNRLSLMKEEINALFGMKKEIVNTVAQVEKKAKKGISEKKKTHGKKKLVPPPKDEESDDPNEEGEDLEGEESMEESSDSAEED